MIQSLEDTINTNIKDLEFWNEQLKKARTDQERNMCIKQIYAGLKLISQILLNTNTNIKSQSL